MRTINTYEPKDICISFKWLGHGRDFTELNAFHPDYKPGREHFGANLENNAFPKIRYARHERDVLGFVDKYAKTHIVCYGLNPRPKILRNEKGFPRAATEKEIMQSKNMAMDFDFTDKKYLDEKLVSLELHLQQFDEYFKDRGFHYPPVRAFTGQGYHLLFAFAPINVHEHPDIGQRIKAFQDDFRKEFSKLLDDLGAKVDTIHDLKRMLKVYGTAKPDIGVLSRFYGDDRKEDDGLRQHLLNLNLPEIKSSTLDNKLKEELPKLFQHLLNVDPKLRELWTGNGKNGDHDTSRSGYDFSIVKHLMNKGYSNLDDLTQILTIRPNGAVKQSGKSNAYIKHTIANAIKG